MDNNLTNLDTEDVVDQLLLATTMMFLGIFPGLMLGVAKILTFWDFVGCSDIEANPNLDRASKEENKAAFTTTLCLRFRSIFETLHGRTFYRFSRYQATFKGLYNKTNRGGDWTCESDTVQGSMVVIAIVMLSKNHYQVGDFLDCTEVYHASNVITILFDKLNIPLKQLVFLTHTQINDLVAFAEHVPVMDEERTEAAEAARAFDDNNEVEGADGDEDNDDGGAPVVVRIRLRDPLSML